MHFSPFTGLILLCAPLFSATAGALLPRQNIDTAVKLRIEGLNKTIFEGIIITNGHNVTTKTGGTHHCDSTNYNAHRNPGPTATSALSNASHTANFTFDGNFTTSLDDFLITTIGSDTKNATHSWFIHLNFIPQSVGGCQQRVTFGDEVLFVFAEFDKKTFAEIHPFLKLDGPPDVEFGKSVILSVTDGITGQVVSNATVGGVQTDSIGHATVTFNKYGPQSFKAEKAGYIRSNKLEYDILQTGHRLKINSGLEFPVSPFPSFSTSQKAIN